MVAHRFPRSSEDVTEYQASTQYWERLWEDVDRYARVRDGWHTPWLSTGDPSIQDGNPIFSAFSEQVRRGIRIIQYPPTTDQVEFDWWLDSFGGTMTDPESIRELVIACALSVEAGQKAANLMNQWVTNAKITVVQTELTQPLLAIAQFQTA
ncbi:MAG: hypothetical protein L0Z62_26640 [Gemmataceae bacterium]|nr:hypothetical protein [Gemmataceae bacterium]